MFDTIRVVGDCHPVKPYYLIFERTADNPVWTLWGARPTKAMANVRAVGHARETACQTVVRRVDLPDDDFLQGCEMLENDKVNP